MKSADRIRLQQVFAFGIHLLAAAARRPMKAHLTNRVTSGTNGRNDKRRHLESFGPREPEPRSASDVCRRITA